MIKLRSTLWWILGFALLGGCSTHPVADVLDCVRPGKMGKNRVTPFGGVCNPPQSQPIFIQPGVGGTPEVPTGPVRVIPPAEPFPPSTPSTPAPPPGIIPPPAPPPNFPN